MSIVGKGYNQISYIFTYYFLNNSAFLTNEIDLTIINNP